MYLTQGVSRIHQELSKLVNGETHNPNKAMDNILDRHFTKKRYINKHIKKNHQEAPIKITWHHYRTIRMTKGKNDKRSVDRNAEKLELSDAAGGNAKRCSHVGNSSAVSLKKTPKTPKRWKELKSLSHKANIKHCLFTRCSSHSIHRICTQEKRKYMSIQRFLDTSVCSNFSHNSKKLETTQVPFSTWMGNCEVALPWNTPCY